MDARAEGERLERLLGEVRKMAGPPTWQRVEELIQGLVGLYGTALGRVLELAVETGAPAEFHDKVCGDDLVASLLLLHGLHPLPVEQRVQKALDGVRPYLGSHAGGVELLGIDSGVVRLRMIGTCRGCPSSAATVEQTLRRAIEEAAPEIARIEVDAATAPSDIVVPLGTAAPSSGVHWLRVAETSEVPPGESRVFDVSGVPALVANLGGTWVAYRARCAACSASLGPSSALEQTLLTCGACRAAFDLAKAGRPSSGNAHLTPIPLLMMDGAVRIAVPGAAA